MIRWQVLYASDICDFSSLSIFACQLCLSCLKVLRLLSSFWPWLFSEDQVPLHGALLPLSFRWFLAKKAQQSLAWRSVLLPSCTKFLSDWNTSRWMNNASVPRCLLPQQGCLLQGYWVSNTMGSLSSQGVEQPRCFMLYLIFLFRILRNLSVYGRQYVQSVWIARTHPYRWSTWS